MAEAAGSFEASSGRSLAEQAYLAIRDRLVSLEIPPGAPVREDRLCAELGLGRTPVREAIKRLEAERLLVIYPRQGTFASEINLTDHALVAEVRRQLEGLAAQRAAERAGTSDRAVLEALLIELDKPPAEIGSPMELDARIHAAVYSCTHNHHLQATLSQYYNLATRIWRAFLDHVDASEHIPSHAELIRAILAGQADRARELAVAHVDNFERAVVHTELAGLGRRLSQEAPHLSI
jgi:DNA-binding GntR family transcriptional regulator